jgi:hypothetical protein
MLDLILPQVANGLVLGGLYVLIAIGLSIIFGLLGIVNFAHGTFFTLGAYFALTLYRALGWPAVIWAPFIVGGVGMIAERVLIRRLYESPRGPVARRSTRRSSCSRSCASCNARRPRACRAASGRCWPSAAGSWPTRWCSFWMSLRWACRPCW